MRKGLTNMDMRILNQKSMKSVVDVPYQSMVVRQSGINLSSVIAFDPLDTSESFFMLAAYSSPEKARRAMEILHQHYIDLWKFENGYSIDTFSIYFQFPEDNDIKLSTNAKEDICQY